MFNLKPADFNLIIKKHQIYNFFHLTETEQTGLILPYCMLNYSTECKLEQKKGFQPKILTTIIYRSMVD